MRCFCYTSAVGRGGARVGETPLTPFSIPHPFIEKTSPDFQCVRKIATVAARQKGLQTNCAAEKGSKSRRIASPQGRLFGGFVTFPLLFRPQARSGLSACRFSESGGVYVALNSVVRCDFFALGGGEGGEVCMREFLEVFGVCPYFVYVYVVFLGIW